MKKHYIDFLEISSGVVDEEFDEPSEDEIRLDLAYINETVYSPKHHSENEY